MDDGSYRGHDRGNDRPSGLLPKDDYSLQLEKLRGLSTKAIGEVETKDFYGNVQTWRVETHRIPDGGDYHFVQRVDESSHALRLVLPPEVTALMARQRGAATKKNRRKGAQQAAATRRALGIVPAFVADPSLRGKRGDGARKKRKARRKR